MTKHLWEVDHSYYCTENGAFDHYDNLNDFLDEWGNLDMDYNLLFRWDWEEYIDYNPDGLDPDDSGKDTLSIYWMQQRKGRYHCCVVRVSKDEEEKVKRFLEPRWLHLSSLWEPLT